MYRLIRRFFVWLLAYSHLSHWAVCEASEDIYGPDYHTQWDRDIFKPPVIVVNTDGSGENLMYRCNRCGKPFLVPLNDKTHNP